MALISVQPERVARQAGLRYVSDADPGFARVRWGKGFRYRSHRGRWLTGEATLRRIEALVLPPAWENVWICRKSNGHLQATGYDARRRKQYRYHAKWSELRNELKFEGLCDFARVLPLIRRRVEIDIARRTLSKDKVLACVVRLLDRTLLRIGSEIHAREHRTYGLTTIRKKHIRVRGSQVTARFQTKGGKQLELEINAPRAARVIRSCQELPGQRLFSYVGADDHVCDIASQDVNEYLGEITGLAITAKDFRTWGGTAVAAEYLDRLTENSEATPISETAFRQREVSAVRAAAAMLGNNLATCRRYYVHPRVTQGDRDGSLARAFAQARRSRSPRGLRVAERAILRLLA